MICFRHQYSQTSANNVNKIWTVDCVLVPASSTLYTVLDYIRLLYTSSSDTIDFERYVTKYIVTTHISTSHMKCWILTKIIVIQIGFNNYGKNVIIRISFSTYFIWSLPRFIQTVVSGTSRHGRNFSFDWHWLHM
jgi:hypothetical protein